MLLTIPELLEQPTLSISWQGSREASGNPIAAFSTDTRTIQAGQVFVAIVGDIHDGHHFIDKAVGSGAAACLVNRSWYTQHGTEFPNAGFMVVEDTLTAYQEIARYYRMKFQIPVIALTGSSGKTTTKEYIDSVLRQKYNVLSNIKSFNNHIGVPATLLNLRPEHEILITELGTNGFGELERLSYLVNPSLCVFTNIGYAHLEHFKNAQGVTRAKMEMLTGMQKGGKVIYNADDEILAGLTYPGPVFSYGTQETSDLKGVVRDCDEHACYRFALDDTEIHLALPGRHNVSNALAAAAVGVQLGLDNDQIKAGLQGCDYVEKRMHVVEAHQLRIIDDTYNANPGSCRAALDTLRDMQPLGKGRRVGVLGDMLELGEFTLQEHVNLLGYARQNGIVNLFLHGDAMAAAIQNVDEHGFQYISHFQDISRLQETLARFTAAHDLVLVKGSRSMKMERIVDYIKAIKD